MTHSDDESGRTCLWFYYYILLGYHTYVLLDVIIQDIPDNILQENIFYLYNCNNCKIVNNFDLI